MGRRRSPGDGEFFTIPQPHQCRPPDSGRLSLDTGWRCSCGCAWKIKWSYAAQFWVPAPEYNREPVVRVTLSE